MPNLRLGSVACVSRGVFYNWKTSVFRVDSCTPSASRALARKAVRRVRSARWRASPSASSNCIAELCAAAMCPRNSTSFLAAADAPVQLIPCLAFSCSMQKHLVLVTFGHQTADSSQDIGITLHAPAYCQHERLPYLTALARARSKLWIQSRGAAQPSQNQQALKRQAR